MATLSEAPLAGAVAPIRPRAVTTVVVLAVVTASIMTAVVRQPFRDEAWFAAPALSLMTTGTTGTPLLTEFSGEGFLDGRRLTRIDTVTYWSMPLHFVSQAAWYALAGFGLVEQRLHSLAWALVALWGIARISRALGPMAPPQPLVLAVCGLDFMFVTMSAHGRMEMMCAALWIAGLALFLEHDGRPSRLAAASALAVASLLTNPLGAIGLLGFVTAVAAGVARRPRVRELAVMAVPASLLFAAWLAYITVDPAAFRDQFLANTSSRLDNLATPFAALSREVTVRYLSAYGLSPGAHPLHGLAALVLVVYAAATIWAAVWGMRTGERRLTWLAGMVISTFLLLTYFDHRKLSFYVVHINVIAGMLTAVAIGYLWRRRPAARPLVAAFTTALLALSVAPSAARAVVNPRRAFQQAASGIPRAADARRTFASAEYAFELGFDVVVDDEWLGWKTGERPGVVVLDGQMHAVRTERTRTRPAFRDYLDGLLADASLQEVSGATVYVVAP